MLFLRNSYLVLGILLSFSCERNKSNESVAGEKENLSVNYPVGFPEINFPDDNRLTVERVTLGKELFFDPVLSADSTISCSSCHQPQFAFADTLRISPGVKNKLGFRNAPSVLNVAYFNKFMLEGGVPTLEIQVVHPLTDTNEMALGINEVIEKLKKIKKYRERSYAAYGRELDPFVVTRALSAYERTLISGNTRYDRFHYGNDKNALNESEQRGMELFFGEELNCGKCHNGFLLTDQSYQNNGLKENYGEDKGRERITHKEEDIGKFKVPSLRNLKYTFPYMHDGSLKTLMDVINHYNSGGKDHPSKSKWVKPLNLTETQKNDLMAFLLALSEEELNN